MFQQYKLNGLSFERMPRKTSHVFVCHLPEEIHLKASEVMCAMYDFMALVPGAESVHCDYTTRTFRGQDYSEVLSVFRESTEE